MRCVLTQGVRLTRPQVADFSRLSLQPIVVALANIAAAGIQYQVREVFPDQPALFHGASITVADVSTTPEQLLQIPGVTVSQISMSLKSHHTHHQSQRVWPVRRRERPTRPRTVDGGSTGSVGQPVTAATLIAGGTKASPMVKSWTRHAKRAASDYSTGALLLCIWVILFADSAFCRHLCSTHYDWG